MKFIKREATFYFVLLEVVWVKLYNLIKYILRKNLQKKNEKAVTFLNINLK